MLKGAFIFYLVAIIAGTLGFWGITGTAAMVARILFFVFALLFLTTLLAKTVATRRA